MTVAPNQTKLEVGRSDLWSAVRTVVRSQRLAPPLGPVSRDGYLPLSFAQQRLWFIYKLQPESSEHNLYLAYRLRGLLDLNVLEQSLKEIVRRHEALRTRFATVEGQAVQAIAPYPEVCQPGAILRAIDLRELSFPEGETEAQRLATEERDRPFDLTRDLLLRGTLLQLGAEDNILLLTIHQITIDNQSFVILIRELTVLYQAFLKGESSPLPELPIQYGDFAHWQRQWLQEKQLSAQLSYWQEKLSTRVPLLRLPTDLPRPAVPNSQGASETFVLPKNLSEALRVLSQREGVTLFATLLAALATLLYRYTAQEDILIFYSTAARNRNELKELIGLFANLLALRSDLSGNPSFPQLLSRVSEVVLGAYANQDLPFSQQVEMLKPERGLSQTSLFQVMFMFQNEPRPTLELSGLTLSPLHVGHETAKFDLCLLIADCEDGLTGTLHYKTDLFNAATIIRMLENFQTLLEGIVANSEQPISDLPLLTDPECRQLCQSNDTQTDDPKSAETFVAPRDGLELQLTKIWEKVLGIQPIGIRDNFFHLGGHSLLTARLVAEIEKNFQKKLPSAALFQAPTVEQLVVILRQEGWSAPWFSLVPIQPSGDKPPLFGIQILGRGFNLYRPLASYLGLSQPIYGLHYGITTQIEEGKQTADIQDIRLETGAASYMVKELAAHYIEEIQTLQPEGPYFLAGISFGGMIAFEMAQQLQARGQKIALLALFDTPAPGAFKQLPTRWLSQKVSQVLKLGPAYVLKQLKQKVNRRIQRSKSISEAKRLKHELQAKNTPLEKYIPQAYTGKITLFRATDRTHFEGYDIEPQLGWGEIAVGGLEIHDLPGSHLSILIEPHVQVLAEKFKVCLDNALT